MTTVMSRREFIAASMAFAAARGVVAAEGGAAPGFLHGVASGDPLQERVILWTRLSGADLAEDVVVDWTVAEDPALQYVVSRGRSITSIERDFTVKVDATGLRPGRTYYYQFRAGAQLSPVGRTRTLPADGVEHARIAFVSCSNLPAGLFNVYALLARRTDLDCVLHLGDYLYEYANGTYGDGTALGRIPQPQREIVSLLDYRERHAQYKRDPDLQAVHAQHPFICVWDDHEITNDAWKDGAQNHQPEAGEGDWLARRRAATRAYFEWMPIREARRNEQMRIFRDFRFGKLADLMMLDTRLHGRDRQSALKPVTPEAGLPADDLVANDPRRSLLGQDQEEWLYAGLVRSRRRGTTWRLLGQQLMMAQLSATGGRTLFNFDQWDGYRPSRERLYQVLRDNAVDNLVVLSGDIHSSWANELTSNPWDGAAYDPATGQGVVGVEFVTPAVSSPGLATRELAERNATLVKAGSPHMKFIDMFHRGYVVLDLTHARVRAEFWHVDRVDQPSREERLASAWEVVAGRQGLSAG
ncbi:MAG: hypothetical protein RL026_2340 [Pseudomonadota bacterium]|jgi:alkaline phosphatase D